MTQQRPKRHRRPLGMRMLNYGQRIMRQYAIDESAPSPTQPGRTPSWDADTRAPIQWRQPAPPSSQEPAADMPPMPQQPIQRQPAQSPMPRPIPRADRGPESFIPSQRLNQLRSLLQRDAEREEERKSIREQKRAQIEAAASGPEGGSDTTETHRRIFRRGHAAFDYVKTDPLNLPDSEARQESPASPPTEISRQTDHEAQPDADIEDSDDQSDLEMLDQVETTGDIQRSIEPDTTAFTAPIPPSESMPAPAPNVDPIQRRPVADDAMPDTSVPEAEQPTFDDETPLASPPDSSEPTPPAQTDTPAPIQRSSQPTPSRPPASRPAPDVAQRDSEPVVDRGDTSQPAESFDTPGQSKIDAETPAPGASPSEIQRLIQRRVDAPVPPAQTELKTSARHDDTPIQRQTEAIFDDMPPEPPAADFSEPDTPITPTAAEPPEASTPPTVQRKPETQPSQSTQPTPADVPPIAPFRDESRSISIEPTLPDDQLVAQRQPEAPVEDLEPPYFPDDDQSAPLSIEPSMPPATEQPVQREADTAPSAEAPIQREPDFTPPADAPIQRTPDSASPSVTPIQREPDTAPSADVPIQRTPESRRPTPGAESQPDTFADAPDSTDFSTAQPSDLEPLSPSPARETPVQRQANYDDTPPPQTFGDEPELSTTPSEPAVRREADRTPHIEQAVQETPTPISDLPDTPEPAIESAVEPNQPIQRQADDSASTPALLIHDHPADVTPPRVDATWRDAPIADDSPAPTPIQRQVDDIVEPTPSIETPPTDRTETPIQRQSDPSLPSQTEAAAPIQRQSDPAPDAPMSSTPDAPDFTPDWQAHQSFDNLPVEFSPDALPSQRAPDPAPPSQTEAPAPIQRQPDPAPDAPDFTPDWQPDQPFDNPPVEFSPDALPSQRAPDPAPPSQTEAAAPIQRQPDPAPDAPAPSTPDAPDFTPDWQPDQAFDNSPVEFSPDTPPIQRTTDTPPRVKASWRSPKPTPIQRSPESPADASPPVPISDHDWGASPESYASPFQSEPDGEYADFSPVESVQRQSDQRTTSPLSADPVQRSADTRQTPAQPTSFEGSHPTAAHFRQPEWGSQLPDTQRPAEAYQSPEITGVEDVPFEDASGVGDNYLQRAPDDDAGDSDLASALSQLGVLQYASQPDTPKTAAPKSTSLTTYTPETGQTPPSPSAIQRSSGVRVEGYTTPPPPKPSPPRVVMRGSDPEDPGLDASATDPAENINVEQLARDVYRRLRDRLRIESERRHR